MSIDAISGSSNWWQSRSQTSAASNATTTSGNTSSDSITNTGSVAANNVSDFMAVFSADLQAMLGQLAADAATATTSSSTTTTAATSTTDQTTASQQSGSTHHHHHQSASDGDDGSVQNIADQLVNEIGQSQSGSLSADQINQSASIFAADVMQALQSYGTTTPTTSSGSILA